MSLQLPFGMKPVNPVPVDAYRYNEEDNPYANTNEVISSVPKIIRHLGMSFYVYDESSPPGVDQYWFKNGVEDEDLIIQGGSDIPSVYDSDKFLVANEAGDSLVYSDISLTELRNALNSIGKLGPTAPGDITTKILVLSSKFSARDKTTGNLRTEVTTDTTPILQLSDMTDSGAFLDPETGNLEALINDSVVGTITLTSSDDTSTNSDLEITQNQDYYLGVSGSAGFYTAILSRINVSSALTPTNTAQSAKLRIGSDETSNYQFYVETSLTPTIASSSLTVDVGEVTIQSGVSILAQGADMSVTATANNVIGYFYNATKTIEIDDSVVGSNMWNPSAGEGGPNYTITNQTITVQSNQTDSNYQPTITAYTSSGVSANSTITPSGTVYVDSSSDSIRSSVLDPGSGQFPSSGYGGAYNHSTSLLTNEALQLLGGKFIYPSGNFTTLYPVAGPNYSSITDWRYMIFSLGNVTNASSVTFTINGATGFSTTIDPSIRLYVKVEDGSTGWLNANAAYPGSGNPTANDANALDLGASTPTTRRVTFGGLPRTGTVYVRIGLNTGSTKTFSSIS